jgi:hypothetical protein
MATDDIERTDAAFDVVVPPPFPPLPLYITLRSYPVL